MARTGMEIMIEKLIRMIGLDPAIVLGHIDAIRKSVDNGTGDIAAIRRDQLRIMAHLGIDDDGREQQGLIAGSGNGASREH